MRRGRPVLPCALPMAGVAMAAPQPDGRQSGQASPRPPVRDFDVCRDPDCDARRAEFDRPLPTCKMRELFVSICRVCDRELWAAPKRDTGVLTERPECGIGSDTGPVEIPPAPGGVRRIDVQ